MSTSTLEEPEGVPSRSTSEHLSTSERLDGVFRKMQKSLRLAGLQIPLGQAGSSREDRLEGLLELAPEERFAEAEKSPEWVDRSLCVQVLVQAKALLGADSEEAENVARLGLFLAERLDPARVPAVVIFDLQAQAWLFLGEARTSSGALARASMALQLAGCLLSCGSGDIELQAAFLEAKARLYRVRGEDELARQATLRASLFLAAGGQTAAESKTRVCS